MSDAFDFTTRSEAEQSTCTWKRNTGGYWETACGCCSQREDTKPDWWPESPYPSTIFPMPRGQYAEIVPDPHTRTALSGMLGREFWAIASDAIWEQFCEAIEDGYLIRSEVFSLFSEMPLENGMRFCPYCGRRLAVAIPDIDEKDEAEMPEEKSA